MSTDGGTAGRDAWMSLRLDGSGIVRMEWGPGVDITEELAHDAMIAVIELTEGRRYPLYVDMTGTASISRAARNAFAHFEGSSRLALVGRSAVDRVLANFALSVSAIPVPTRFFTSEAAALNWLCDGLAAA